MHTHCLRSLVSTSYHLSPPFTISYHLLPALTSLGNALQAFTRVDTQTGEAQTWFPGRRCFCEELIFVNGPNSDTVEDDGYLLGLVYDASKHRTFLAVCWPACYIETWCVQ